MRRGRNYPSRFLAGAFHITPLARTHQPDTRQFENFTKILATFYEKKNFTFFFKDKKARYHSSKLNKVYIWNNVVTNSDFGGEFVL